MNLTIITGRLTRDPETRTTQSGDIVTTFTVAVNSRKKNAAGENPPADFFRVTAWKNQGEFASRYLKKGFNVLVYGAVHLNTFTGKDGKDRASLELQAISIESQTTRSEAEALRVAEQSGAAAALPPVATQGQEVKGPLPWDDSELESLF